MNWAQAGIQIRDLLALSLWELEFFGSLTREISVFAGPLLRSGLRTASTFRGAHWTGSHGWDDDRIYDGLEHLSEVS